MISYQLAIKGRPATHQVQGQHIRASPFDIINREAGYSIVEVNGPWGIATNQRGVVVMFVVSPSRECLLSFGTSGSGQGQFNRPCGIAVDNEESFLVADCSNHRIQKFTAGGKFLTMTGYRGNGPLQFQTLPHSAIRCTYI